MYKNHLKILCSILLGISFCLSALAAESGPLDGKWKGERIREGNKFTYTLEIAKDKFSFELKNSEGEVRMVAKGKVKLDKQGVFKTITLLDIEAGQSSTDLQPVTDTRSYVYATGWKTLTMAGNFDRDRDNEEPNLIVYRKE